MPPTKQCPGCREWLPATPGYYYRNKARPTGLGHRCITCTKRDREERAAVAMRMRSYCNARFNVLTERAEVNEAARAWRVGQYEQDVARGLSILWIPRTGGDHGR